MCVLCLEQVFLLLPSFSFDRFKTNRTEKEIERNQKISQVKNEPKRDGKEMIAQKNRRNDERMMR